LRRYFGDGASRLVKPEPFVREEHEHPITLDRATDHATKVVLMFLRFRQPQTLHEVVSGIERIISEVFEDRAMELIASRSRHDRDLAAGHSPEFRRVGRGLYLELLQCVNRDKAIGSALSAETRSRPDA